MSWFFFEVSTLELVLEVTALAVTLVWAAATWAMVVLENAAALRFSILFATAEPAFVVYKMLQLFVINGVRLRAGATPGQFAVVGASQQPPRLPGQLLTPSRSRPAGGTALILRALLIEYLVTASRNFGRGLRRKGAVAGLPRPPPSPPPPHGGSFQCLLGKEASRWRNTARDPLGRATAPRRRGGARVAAAAPSWSRTGTRRSGRCKNR